MAERLLRPSAVSLSVERLLQRPLTRRQFNVEALRRGAAVASILAIDGAAMTVAANRETIEELLQRAFPDNEFTENADPLSQAEILADEHQEEELGFREAEFGGEHFFRGTFEGPGAPVYLELPPVYRPDPRLTVFDIQIDNRLIRTGFLSGREEPKRIILGRFPEATSSSRPHHIRISQIDTREKTIITPDEIVPRLWSPTTPTSLRSIVNDTVAFTLPRDGEAAWNDCITGKVTVPYRQDGNYRLVGWKATTAEDSRWEGVYEDWGRTYDEDWETKIEVTPEGEIRKVQVQKRGHLTKNYNSGLLMFGTHPLLEVYTENGMVRPAQNYYPGQAYFADEPKIVPAQVWDMLRGNHVVDVALQEASFDELKREKKDPETLGRLIVDFRQRRLGRRKT